jgi:hypothetical protein
MAGLLGFSALTEPPEPYFTLLYRDVIIMSIYTCGIVYKKLKHVQEVQWFSARPGLLTVAYR